MLYCREKYDVYMYTCTHAILTTHAICMCLHLELQLQVDNGIPLGVCLSRFRHWLTTITADKQLTFTTATTPSPSAVGGGHGAAAAADALKTCAFVTWSDWDIAVCLQYECRRKQLRVPVQMHSWIDLRATYRVCKLCAVFRILR